ncbi:MAG: T9SS type A sorting domain-containing protein, partial [Sphingobacteriaceae bacterium]
PPNAIVTWTTSGAVQIVGSNTANPVTVGKAYDGTGTLSANITSNCSNKTISKTIKVGSLSYQSISAQWKDWIDGSSIIFSVPYTQGVTYQWIIDGYANPNATGSSFIYPANSCYSTDPIQIYWNVKVVITNSCGSSTICRNFKLSCNSYPKLSDTGSCYVNNGELYDLISVNDNFIIYPNPSNDLLTISQQINLREESINNTLPYSAKLYDAQGLIYNSGESRDGTNLVMDVSQTPNGTYFLHIQQGETLIKKQIIIQH